MTRRADAGSLAPNLDPLAGRYELAELLGRGGMASVHRAIDRARDRSVALKRLTLEDTVLERASVTALFEREYHTLKQLRHPHVIGVYDYGVSADGAPFYTMELLDGGDLREQAPVDWRDACRLVFQVCSALALLHSRRLLHRDLTPRNIRCTQTGQAKLIDFGAMAPMSAGGADVVGTPAFTAPETVQRLALDGRTDLYSLGVTLYFALTARVPYPARSFADLLAGFRSKPVRPSALARDIPPALDDLVLAMISVEPALRPQSAFDVMQQLAACADLRLEESEAVSRAYLATPSLVGRDDDLGEFRELLRDARLRRVSGLILEGPSGAGRSRLLDAFALEAQTRGFTVLRATASNPRAAFSVAHDLAQHVLDALPLESANLELSELLVSPAPANDNERSGRPARPELRELAELAELEPGRVQRALRRWLLGVSRTHPLLIAVDDLQRIDAPSAALLAELLDRTPRGGILVALTADSEGERTQAWTALQDRCSPRPLRPLRSAETRELLRSLFGDVAHLEMLAAEIHRVARGNPRQSLELAQHLVERGAIRYASGHWTLPSRVTAEDLPRSAAEALAARVEALSPEARFLAGAQALAFFESFALHAYRALLPGTSAEAVDAALSELVAAQVITRDGSEHRLSNRVWAAALLDRLTADDVRERHRALAGMYAAETSLAFVHHAFAGGLEQLGLEALDQRNEIYRAESDFRTLLDQNVGKLIWCYEPAIATAQALGRSRRDIVELRRWQYLGSVVAPEPPNFASARLYFDQLAHDSGLSVYRADTLGPEGPERLMRALHTAQQRYLATPESERVYPVDEAIRKLAEYVVVSLAIGGKTLDIQLVRDLPEGLEPFISLSPLLDAIWNNALAARAAHCDCQYEAARVRWRETLARLDALPNTGEHFVTAMRNAIAHALGLMEAQLGLASAASWADRLDDDPLQRVSAFHLRRIVRLEQGDIESAERLRRQAEVLALSLQTPSMFKSLLIVELGACAKLRDLAGVTRIIEEMRSLAAHHPGWALVLLHAEATFHLTRGDAPAAREIFERCIEHTGFQAGTEPPHLAIWIGAHAGLAECHLALGDHEAARAVARRALDICEARQLDGASFDVLRSLALAEAKLGDPGGVQRLESLIASQHRLGMTGLRLGLSYEARARIAVWSGDAAGFERYAELTAREYRHGARSRLAARYERLMNEAARAGMRAKHSLADFEALAGQDSGRIATEQLLTVITRSMAEHASPDQRAQLALQMICAAHGSGAGHLFLFTAAGLALRASQGAGTPAVELADRVQRYVTETLQQAAELDDMETDAVPDADELTSLVRTEEESYELLSLGCVRDAARTLVGVAAVRIDGPRVRNVKQAQLLHALAASLLQSGDSPGAHVDSL